MVNTEIIRVVNAGDLSSIPATEADILLVFDRDTTVVNGTLPFPTNPIRGQSYVLSTKIQITNFGTDTGGRDISGVPSILPIGVAGWVYESESDEWFPLHNPPLSVYVQALIEAKQNSLASGANIKTINGVSILGSGDLSVSGSGLTQSEVLKRLSFRI